MLAGFLKILGRASGESCRGHEPARRLGAQSQPPHKEVCESSVLEQFLKCCICAVGWVLVLRGHQFRVVAADQYPVFMTLADDSARVVGDLPIGVESQQ